MFLDFEVSLTITPFWQNKSLVSQKSSLILCILLKGSNEVYKLFYV